MSRALMVAAIAPLLCFAQGCGFDLEFKPASQPPITTVVSPTSIKITEGIAMSVTVLDGTEPIDLNTQVTFSPASPILAFKPTSRPEKFVIFGISPGKTTVKVLVDGDEDSSIPAEVLPQ